MITIFVGTQELLAYAPRSSAGLDTFAIMIQQGSLQRVLISVEGR